MDGADRRAWRSAPDVTGSVWDQIRSATALVSGLDLVEGGVGKIDVFRVHLLLAHPQALTEALEVHDLPLPQEADHVVDIRVIAQAQDIVICEPRLLLRGQILRQVCDDVASGLDGGGGPGEAGGGGGIPVVWSTK